MNVYWTTTRPNGNPIEPGTFACVTDPENGENPIWTYGRTEAEVAEKMARTLGHAQATLARRAPATGHEAGAQPAQPNPRAVAQPRSLSADDVMQATADLQNPARAGQAAARLVQHETGLDLLEMAKKQYAVLYLEWEREHDEMAVHPSNRKHIGERAIRMAGNKPALVTREMLDASLEQCMAEGLIVLAETQTPEPPTALPAETQVQHTERPQKRPFATGVRSTSFRAPATPPTRALKYTLDQYRKIVSDADKMVGLIGDPDFEAAVAAYEPRLRTA